MKEIKEMVEKVVGYEASDGTKFTDKEECEKYENTARAVVAERFQKLVVKEIEGSKMTKDGCAFVLSGVDEDIFYALVEIKDENDLYIAQMFHETVNCHHAYGLFDESMVGKKVIVYVGEGIYPRPDSGKKCKYDDCFVYGTIEDQVEKYKKALGMLEETEKETKEENEE